MSNLTPFHLAIPVNNLSKCRDFYKNVLGCIEGRSSDHWIDFDFFGHQLVIHFKEKLTKELDKNTNIVDGKDVPVPHFGVVLEWQKFQQLSNKLSHQNIKFIIKPYIRFKGLAGEQATMFFKDPSGNALEFKSFKKIDQIFRK